MKLFIISLVFSVAAAGSASYPPKFAYLVVPPGSQLNSTTETNTTTVAPTTPHDDKENLEAVNERVMERFRQESGSNSGVYHVYHPDGRLQKVQFTTAPVAEGKPEQGVQDQEPKNEKQKDSTSEQFVNGVQGIYYVQVPEERFQQLRTFQYPSNTEGNQATQNGAFARYEENPAAQVKVQFLPLRFVSAEQMSQIRSSADQPAAFKEAAASANEELVRQQFTTSQRYNKQAEEATPGFVKSSQVQAKSEESQPGYVASLRYTDVQPITGPVFSYSAQDLIRILRHAGH